MDFFKDLWGYMKVRKTFWLLPIILTLLLLTVVIFLVSASALGPLLYSFF